MGLINNVEDIYRLPPRLKMIMEWRLNKKESKRKGSSSNISLGLVPNMLTINGKDIEISELNLTGWGEKSMNNLIDAIEASRKLSSERLAACLT